MRHRGLDQNPDVPLACELYEQMPLSAYADLFPLAFRTGLRAWWKLIIMLNKWTMWTKRNPLTCPSPKNSNAFRLFLCMGYSLIVSLVSRWTWKLTEHLSRACVFDCITCTWWAGKSQRTFSVGLEMTMDLHGRQTFDVTLATVESSCWKKVLGC